MSGYIYVNFYPNGYMYVGQHTYDKKELDPNYTGSSKFAKRYGWKPDRIEILEFCDDRETLNEAERVYILRYLNLLGVAPCVRQHNPRMAEPFVDGFMLNEQMGGYQIPSEETCRKYSESNRNRVYSEETRRKLSESRKGKRLSEETRRKIGEYHKGKHLSEETRRKISEANSGRCGELNPMYGKHHSEETRKKMSEALSGKHHSEETRRKMSEAHKGVSVMQFSKDGVFIREWESVKLAAESLCISPSHISHCCRGRLKSIGGFKWKYK